MRGEALEATEETKEPGSEIAQENGSGGEICSSERNTRTL